jgi:hypothetical protein
MAAVASAAVGPLRHGRSTAVVAGRQPVVARSWPVVAAQLAGSMVCQGCCCQAAVAAQRQGAGGGERGVKKAERNHRLPIR